MVAPAHSHGVHRCRAYHLLFVRPDGTETVVTTRDPDAVRVPAGWIREGDTDPMTKPDTLGEFTELQDALARRLLLLAELQKRVAKAITDTKAELDLRSGSTLKPLLPDGTPAGIVYRPTGNVTAEVHDEAAFTDWMTARYPTMVEQIVRVRPGARAHVLDMAKAANVPIGPGGEVGPDAPAGLSVHEGNTTGPITVRPDRDHADALWAAVRGELLPAIAAGEPA